MLPPHVTDEELSNPDKMSRGDSGYVKTPHLEHIVVLSQLISEAFVNVYDIFELVVLSITGHFVKSGLIVTVILRSGGTVSKVFLKQAMHERL